MAEERRHPEWSGTPLMREAQEYLAREDFVQYIRAVAPWFLVEYAHVAIARHLEGLLKGEIDRLQINMGPRTGKSVMTSELFPSWWLGHYPGDKIMAGGHSESLQKDFGGEVRALVMSPSYQSIFPGVALVPNRKSGGRWAIRGPETFRDGTFFAFGAGTHIAGRGFNLGSLDDATSEQDKDSDFLMEKMERWYSGGFYTRRQPERNAIVITSTRWRYDDLPGRLLEKAKNDDNADQWTVLNVPALLDRGASMVVRKFGETDPEVSKTLAPEPYEEGNEDLPEDEQVGSFLPRRMPLKFLMASRGNMSSRDWNAQYMGRPTEEEGAIIKKKWWRKWPKNRELPDPEDIAMTLTFVDTAFEATEEADESAATTWHLFKTPDSGRDGREYEHYHALLAGAWSEQVDAIDLLSALQTEVIDVFHPNMIIVEKRASGIQLIQEMRRARMPVRSWLPPGPPGSKGKRPRAFASQVVFEQGGVHYLESDWAKVVIDQCARFPFGAKDDLVDTVTNMCIFVRRHFWLGLPIDEDTEEEEFEQKRVQMNTKKRRLYGSLDPRPKGRPFEKSERKLYG